MIRLGPRPGLIFFAACLIFSCKGPEHHNIEITWKNRKAVALSMPGSVVNKTGGGGLEVRLQGSGTSMLGELHEDEGLIIFKPLVAFTRGRRYELFSGNVRFATVDIPADTTRNAPILEAIYPSSDTVPMNLLKMYFRFSSAMHAGESLRHITLLDVAGDTLAGAFLELQPELWNSEGTVLTVWLDPGRIKRDLIPNRKFGNPLRSGRSYTLVVSKDWKDLNGIPLQQSFSKHFLATDRDSLSPYPQQWQIAAPEAGTNGPLTMSFGEPLDYYLAMETMHIFDAGNQPVRGRFSLAENEHQLRFIPASPWQAGTHRVKIDPVLEDIAGNNLERLFDRDILALNETTGMPQTEIFFTVASGKHPIPSY